MLTALLCLLTFIAGFYVGKIAVLKETTKAYKEYNEKITFNPTKKRTHDN